MKHSFLVSAALAIIATGAFAEDYTIHIVEPAINNHLILKTGPLPPVCKEAVDIKLWACPGEYEPASFVVTATKPLEEVQIEVGQLSGRNGKWPKEAVDVRVVKDYYRGTLAGGAAAIPTLLVHDESFLAIEPDPTEKDPNHMKNVARGELRDAAKLQPVTIKNRKQFWITVHVPENAKPGTYGTKLKIAPQNSAASNLTLQVKVHPFELLPPMLEYSIYYPVYLGRNLPPDNPHSFGDVSEEQYVAEQKNMLAHGLSNPNIYQGPGLRPDGSVNFSMLEKILDMREGVGMRPKTLYLVGSGVNFYDRPLKPEERRRTHQVVRQVNAWARQRGYDEVFYMAADEWWGERLSKERDSMVAVREAGGKVFVAVMHTPFFEHVGDVLDLPVLNAAIGRHISWASRKYRPQESLRHMAEIARAGSFVRTSRDPKFRKAIDGVHRLGNKIFTYMNPAGGIPLPDLQRRNEGLGLWRVGFDGTMTWAYIHIVGDKVQQSMYWGKVYRTADGVLDTPHWEGFREGVDDVRYLTTLLRKLGEASGRFPTDPLIPETHAWLGKIDVANGDLDGIRREMARRITAIMNLGYRDVPPEKVLEGIDLKQVKVVTFPEPWRFKIDNDDKGVKGKWFDSAIDDSGWAKIRTDKNVGWEKQGFGGLKAYGYGWYRAELPFTEKDMGRKFKYLYFEAIDEQAWLYLNGQDFFEQTVKSTGILIEELWLTPFSVPLAGVELRGKDRLAVRVHNSTGMGGIWKPVHLVLSDQELLSDQLHALMKLRQRKPEGEK